MSWSSKKPASTASGYIDRSRQMTLKAMSSIPRRLRSFRSFEGGLMTTFSWLHLTDLYLGMSGQYALWPTFKDL